MSHDKPRPVIEISYGLLKLCEASMEIAMNSPEMQQAYLGTQRIFREALVQIRNTTSEIEERCGITFGEVQRHDEAVQWLQAECALPDTDGMPATAQTASCPTVLARLQDTITWLQTLPRWLRLTTFTLAILAAIVGVHLGWQVGVTTDEVMTRTALTLLHP